MTTSTADIRKIQLKSLTRGWVQFCVEEMTFEQAIAKAKAAIEADDKPEFLGLRISILRSNWVEEFSGNRNFEYIGVPL